MNELGDLCAVETSQVNREPLLMVLLHYVGQVASFSKLQALQTL